MLLHPPTVTLTGHPDSPFTAMRRTPLGTVLWECGVAYVVGQLGVLRLFDLKNHVVRRGLKASGAQGGLLTHRYLGKLFDSHWWHISIDKAWYLKFCEGCFTVSLYCLFSGDGRVGRAGPMAQVWSHRRQSHGVPASGGSHDLTLSEGIRISTLT